MKVSLADIAPCSNTSPKYYYLETESNIEKKDFKKRGISAHNALYKRKHLAKFVAAAVLS